MNLPEEKGKGPTSGKYDRIKILFIITLVNITVYCLMSRLASRSILIFSNGELYFLPLALAAFRFGLKGALAAHKGLTKDFNFGAVEFPACCYKKKKTPLMRREWGA